MEGNRCDAKNIVNIQDCLKKHAEDEIGCTIPPVKKSNGYHPICDKSDQEQNLTVNISKEKHYDKTCWY
jgi:hypothetical protein